MDASNVNNQNKQFFDEAAKGQAFPKLDSIIRRSNGDTYKAHSSDGLTVRQYAAIKLRVPDSGDEWLDAMILASLRDKFASQVIVGGVINSCSHVKPDSESWAQYFSRISYQIADAMIAER